MKPDNDAEFEKWLRSVPKPEINERAKAKTIHEVTRIMAQKKVEVQQKTSSSLFMYPKRFAYAIVSFLAGIMMSGTFFVSVSYALPNSFLYPIKLFSEKVFYDLHLSPSGKAELKIVFSQERLDELNRSYIRSGHVDKQVLMVLLKDAEDALQISKTLPLDKKEAIQKKVDYINQQKVQSLTVLEQHVTGEEKSMVRSCRQSCQKMVKADKPCCIIN